MIVFRGFARCDVGVFGLARSGLSSVRSLVAGGARVYAWDDTSERREEAHRLGATILPFADWPWASLRALILSPGVPLTHPKPHPVVSAAQDARVEIIGDIDLFALAIGEARAKAGLAPVIAVTGTNGKSTTTALIGHILSQSGFSPEIGGNIGKPVLDLQPPGEKTIYVLELSSYQIELSPSLTPDVSVLTNITPDHIDRHGSIERYAAIKAKLLSQTAKAGRICAGVDDPLSVAAYSRVAALGGAETVPVSVGKILGRGIFTIDGILYDAQAQRATQVADLSTIARLPGAHNWQNAALAYAATKPFVVDSRRIADAMSSFPGLSHRMEDAGRVGKVRFINDSKATNADAAERALVCHSDIFWIAGGRAKEAGIESLKPHFDRIAKAYLIGEAAPAFSATLQEVPHEIANTLDQAVAHAYADARASGNASPIVLFSPACASFDQFRDFEHRGDVFKDFVKNLSVLERQAS